MHWLGAALEVTQSQKRTPRPLQTVFGGSTGARTGPGLGEAEYVFGNSLKNGGTTFMMGLGFGRSPTLQEGK